MLKRDRREDLSYLSTSRTCDIMKKEVLEPAEAKGERQQDLGPSQAEVSIGADRARAPARRGHLQKKANCQTVMVKAEQA